MVETFPDNREKLHFHSYLEEMLPSSYEINFIVAPKYSPCVTNVIWATYQKHARVLQSKCYLNNMAGTFSWCHKENAILAKWHDWSPGVEKRHINSATWQICSILIAHWADSRYIADIKLLIRSFSATFFPCSKAMLRLPHFCNSHVTTHVTWATVPVPKKSDMTLRWSAFTIPRSAKLPSRSLKTYVSEAVKGPHRYSSFLLTLVLLASKTFS